MVTVRVLSDDDVAGLLALDDLLSVIADAFRRQGEGAVERPERPHFPVGAGLDPDRPDETLGTGLTMPAYIHGADYYATKLVAVHPGNVERGLPTVNAQIALMDAATGQAVAYMDGTRITNARTGCVGGLAARELAIEPVRLGVIGAGTQARWQTRAIAAATDIERVRVYSPSDSKYACAEDLESELGVDTTAVDSPEDALSGATVVVTATTATAPVFPGEALESGTLVVAVGAYTADTRELDAITLERAARIFADVPEEVAEIGDLLDADVGIEDLIPFSDVVVGDAGRESDDEILVVDSVGSAVMDAASAEHVFDEAERMDIGTTVSL